ncbi:radical SAM protein [Deferribacterales bacterium RsTz2092]|nr:UDP pyrophosphate phosphatase [Deferribacterales bacterium]
MSDIDNEILKELQDVKGRLSGVQQALQLQRVQQSMASSKLAQLEMFVEKTTPMGYMRALELHLADHCNFSCSGCSHYSPLAEESFADIAEFERDLTRLAELNGGYIGEMRLMGGEPLLHPNITPFFEVSRRLFPDSDILLVTNGALLMKQDNNFWDAIKQNRIILSPTKYPTIDWGKIEAYANRFGVQLKYFEQTDKSKKESHYYPIDISGGQPAPASFLRCKMANGICPLLQHGKLYPCSPAANIRHFNKYFNKSLSITELDYLDIYKVGSLSEILNFFARPVPFCRYCATTKQRSLGAFKMGARDINEWILQGDEQ